MIVLRNQTRDQWSNRYPDIKLHGLRDFLAQRWFDVEPERADVLYTLCTTHAAAGPV
ncbi:hypothetical protein [Caballeronia humi]|uniref:Uncharacterized protein n=1 Tax=Caballeronia humi TaxID=326474 RepID=A0A158IM09_9BURK|nr:hypothetical protein [Caballeronia humi]SAL57537.1 hypothetical protein AWB65_05055 [Caballeronia humi]